MAKAQFENVLAHWGTLVESFQMSSLEFYRSVEAALQRREVPEIHVSRVSYKESGVLSAKREYLRVSRHHLLFDICAAPFGTGFFFSWWQVLPPPRFGVLFGLLLLALLLWVARSVYGAMGPAARELARESYGVALLLNSTEGRLVASLVAVGLVYLLLCSIARMGVRWLEDFLLPIPIVGWIYQRLFRPATYYELDTMAMYRTAVHAAVTEVIDGLSNAKGLRALSPDERKPILREFYKR